MNIKKGSVCIVNLLAGVGREQCGQRPAIFISDTKTNIAVIIPLTTNLEALRFPYTLIIFPDRQNKLNQQSVALIFQIRAIDKSRIIRVIGKVNKNTERKINEMLKEMLGL